MLPGNTTRFVHKRDGFGLDTDRKRLVRLFFQPVPVALAIWPTSPRQWAPEDPHGAWRGSA